MLHRQKTMEHPQWWHKQNVGRINMNLPNASAPSSVNRNALSAFRRSKPMSTEQKKHELYLRTPIHQLFLALSNRAILTGAGKYDWLLRPTQIQVFLG
jgi:hypothetical protein